MNKIIFTLIISFSSFVSAKEFDQLQNVLNGSCKDHTGIISEYVSGGTLDDKTTIAGERSYKNFFKQGTDVLDSYIENNREMTPEVQCRADFYAAAVTETGIYWKDFADRQGCQTSEMVQIEELSAEEAEVALSMDKKPEGCNDQHWNAIAQNLQAIRNLDKFVSQYADQNGISSTGADQADSDDAESSGDGQASAAGSANPSPSVDIPQVQEPAAVAADGGNPSETAPSVKTEATAEQCFDCGDSDAGQGSAQSLQAEADKVFKEISPDKSCCDIIKAMYLRNGRATKNTPLTDQGCKEVMADDPGVGMTGMKCVGGAIYGALTNVRDSITALFDLGTYAAIPQLLESLSTEEGVTALLRNLWKENTTDMFDYWSCLKPGAAFAAKCEYLSSVLVGIIGAGKFAKLVLAPIKSAKRLGALGKTAKEAQRAADAAKVVARTKVFETARAYAQGRATLSEVNKAATAARMGTLSRVNALDIAISGRVGQKTIRPVMNVGQRALTKATAPAKSFGSKISNIFRRSKEIPIRPLSPRVQKLIKAGDVKGIRKEIKSLNPAQKQEALSIVVDNVDSKRNALLRAQEVALAQKDQLKMARYSAEAKKLEATKSAISSDLLAETRSALHALPRADRIQKANGYLKEISIMQDELAAGVEAAKIQKNALKMKLLNDDLERLQKFRAVVGAEAK